MALDEIERVVHTWMGQFRELGGLDEINHVQIFENRGAMMGASNPHPHCQIWATASIPEAPSKELLTQKAYRESPQRVSCCATTLGWRLGSSCVWSARTRGSLLLCRSGLSGPSKSWSAAAATLEA